MTTKVSLIYAIPDKIFYSEDKALEILKEKGMTSDAWEFVKTIETPYDRKDGKLDLQICELLFEATNIGSELRSVEDQIAIKNSKHHHTSMSVGDLVMIFFGHDDSELYLCADCGFEKVTDINRLALKKIRGIEN